MLSLVCLLRDLMHIYRCKEIGTSRIENQCDCSRKRDIVV